MYEKHAEDPNKSILRVRIVYPQPRARTSSGLVAHTLYQEVSSAPVTFQSIRAARAAGALKGFITSTRDAEDAYLQAKLGGRANAAETWVALPQAFWPEGWAEVLEADGSSSSCCIWSS